MDCFKVLLYLTSYICCLSMLMVGSVGLTRAFTQVFHNILQKAWMNFLANPVFAWIKKKKLWIKCSQLTLEALFTFQKTSWVWVSSHTRRDCLDDLTKNSRDLQSDSGFERCSGCFIRFLNSRVYPWVTSVYSSPSPPPPQGKFWGRCKRPS